MYEAVENGSDYVLLLDDDIVVEPESIVRLLTSSRTTARSRHIVGGHMFDLYDRSVLHTFGEVVNPYRIVPALPPTPTGDAARLRVANLRQTPVDAPARGRGLQRLVDVPDPHRSHPGDRSVAAAVHQMGRRRIRRSVPRTHGFATVSLPGCGRLARVLDRQGRPRGVAGVLPRTQPVDLRADPQPVPEVRRRASCENSIQSDVKHLVSMQYFTEQGRIEALKDLLRTDRRPARHAAAPSCRKSAPEGSSFPDAQLKDERR